MVPQKIHKHLPVEKDIDSGEGKNETERRQGGRERRRSRENKMEVLRRSAERSTMMRTVPRRRRSQRCASRSGDSQPTQGPANAYLHCTAPPAWHTDRRHALSATSPRERSQMQPTSSQRNSTTLFSASFSFCFLQSTRLQHGWHVDFVLVSSSWKRRALHAN